MVEALDVIRFAASLADSLMALFRENLGVRIPEVVVEDGTLLISSKQRVLQPLRPCLAEATDKYADDLSGGGVQG